MSVRARYEPPNVLVPEIDGVIYRRWLTRKAAAYRKRDRRRGNTGATIESYKRAIHDAVCRSQGCDAYTGEMLDWRLISTYDNARSKVGRRVYKDSLALLPTVDHVGDGLSGADFKICGWQTNDCKSSLSYLDFIAFCRRVIAHHEQTTRGST